MPPPGVGEKTVTIAVPADVRSLAGITACNRVLLTNVVGRLAPFQRTVEELTKPLPLTLNVNPGPPTGPLEGDSEPIAGTGLTPTTVTVGLLAASTYPLFGNKRNSYNPAVVGMVTVQLR